MPPAAKPAEKNAMSKDSEQLQIIFVTCVSDEEARKIADGLVSGRLAACVNIASVDSIFRWQGNIEDESERLLVIKTVKSRFDDIERFVKENHSYTNPEIIALGIEKVSAKYAEWVRSESE